LGLAGRQVNLWRRRKEVESDSVSVHHRDSEVADSVAESVDLAVSVAVFDDVDVSK
jgi:hypothetical protein